MRLLNTRPDLTAPSRKILPTIRRPYGKLYLRELSTTWTGKYESVNTRLHMNIFSVFYIGKVVYKYVKAECIVQIVHSA